MTRINPIDLSFLLLERANRPNHMAAYTIFEKPKGQKSSFGPRLFDAYRHSQAVVASGPAAAAACRPMRFGSPAACCGWCPARRLPALAPARRAGCRRPRR